MAQKDESLEQNETLVDEAEEEVFEPVQESASDEVITWQAQEYVHAKRGGWWYILFAVVVAGFVALDVFILRSWTFSALVVVAAVALIVYANRPPRTLTYTLSGRQGLHVGDHLYPLGEFKSFGLLKDEGGNSIMLIPRKRFAPGVSVYFPEDAGEEIVDILGRRLPMEELKLDLIDHVVRLLRL